MDKRKVIYYSDELNDEFSTAVITARKIDESYDYGGRKTSWKLKRFFLYRIIAFPVAFFYLKLVFAHKVVGQKKVRKFKKSAIFFYGNHTNTYADPLVPSFVSFPKSTFVIVHPANVSIPFWGKFMPYLGALPLPDNLKAGKNFLDTIRLHVAEKASIVIYPEAHIWPFYTKIRPFVDLSFKYPVEYRAPVFCFTNVYTKRRFTKKPKMTTYIDGPFFADESLPPKERRKKLRDEVYAAMCERSKLSDFEAIKYVKKETKAVVETVETT